MFVTNIIGLGLIFEMPISVFSLIDASYYGALEVAGSARFHSRDCSCRGNCHTDHRHLEHESFRLPNGIALRHQYRSGLASESPSRARSRRLLACASESRLM